jgi:hypothetical protein
MTYGRPRRRSIFGGFLLILLGTLFLLNNFLPEFHGWELFGKWWPVILIVWGLAKLFDFFAVRRTGEIPPRTLTGGDIGLLILLLMFAGFFSGVTWIRSHGEEIDIHFPWDRSYTFDEEVTKAARAGATIRVRTDRGNISVHPEETPEIRVLVKKEVLSGGERDAARRAAQVTLEIVETGDGYEVRPKQLGEGGRGVRLNLEVHLPKQSTIEARTDRGEIQVSGVAGGVTAVTRSGSVELRDIGGETRIEMRGGDGRVLGARGAVRLTGRGSQIEIADVEGETTIEGEFSGPIRVRNSKQGARFKSSRTDLTVGPLPGRLELAGGNLEIFDCPSNVSVVTRNKDIVMENVMGRVSIENRRGDVVLRMQQPPKEAITVTNEAASIELLLPAKSGFAVSASSRGGNIQNSFDDPGLKMTESENISRLEGTFGRGPQIQLQTTYGDIRLRKVD